jgi:hypothetical protein
MRRDPKRLRRHALVWTVMIISGGCSGHDAPADSAASGDELASVEAAGEAAPAHLVELSGPVAEELARYEYAEPVLVAYTAEGWAAVVFSNDADDIPALLDKLLVQEVHGPGCVPDGAVACCDEETGSFVLNTERGWLRLGQRCEEPPDNPEEEKGVDVVQLPQALTQELFACCGIIDEYVDLAYPDGTSRMLWNWPPVTPSMNGELSLPRSMIQTWGPARTSPIAFVVTPESDSPIVLAHDHPPPSPACVNNEPPQCRKRNNMRCHASREHWYVKSRTTGRWCQRAGCQC